MSGKAKLRPRKGWFKFQKRDHDLILENSKSPPYGLAVWVTLLRLANDGRKPWVEKHIALIANLAGCGYRTVHNELKMMERIGMIRVQRRLKQGLSNIYTLYPSNEGKGKKTKGGSAPESSTQTQEYIKTGHLPKEEDDQSHQSTALPGGGSALTRDPAAGGKKNANEEFSGGMF